MSIEGIDFSWARPGGQAIADAGKHFVVRYVPYAGDGGKGLTKAEIADYRAHGLAICLVFESSAGRALTAGLAGGIADAKVSQAALSSLGMPLDLPIYFAVDRDVDVSHQPAIDAYLRGASSVIGLARVGVYGEYSLMLRCRANGTASWFWETYAWSYSNVASFIHLYQYSNGHTLNGGSVDYCRAPQAGYGQWPAPPPDSSTEVNLITTITVLPYGGGIYVIEPNTAPVAIQFDPSTGVIGSTLAWPAQAEPSSAAYDAIMSTTAMKGDPFLRCTNGHFAGYWLSAGQVTETPNPPPATALTQDDVDAAVLAQATADSALREADLAAERATALNDLAEALRAAELDQEQAVANASLAATNTAIEAEQTRLATLLGLTYIIGDPA